MIYKIKKGRHYSRHFPKFHFGKTNLKFNFVFGAGSWFPLEVPDDHARNKLCGIGYANHHKNSARVGWTPNPETGKIDLFFYVYCKGIRIEEYFTSVTVSYRYAFEMDISNDLLSFKINGPDGLSHQDSIYFKLPWFRWGMRLNPFIGGKLPARTDTYIELTF